MKCVQISPFITQLESVLSETSSPSSANPSTSTSTSTSLARLFLSSADFAMKPLGNLRRAARLANNNGTLFVGLKKDRKAEDEKIESFKATLLSSGQRTSRLILAPFSSSFYFYFYFYFSTLLQRSWYRFWDLASCTLYHTIDSGKRRTKSSWPTRFVLFPFLFFHN